MLLPNGQRSTVQTMMKPYGPRKKIHEFPATIPKLVAKTSNDTEIAPVVVCDLKDGRLRCWTPEGGLTTVPGVVFFAKRVSK